LIYRDIEVTCTLGHRPRSWQCSKIQA